MSADNWGICPVCHPGGNIDEYEHTLREDYEQGMQSDGEYYVIYSCSCKECGFRWGYRHTEQVVKDGKPKP